MTAEIAVFNSSAIALAADSAATTISNGLVKINNSANKLFELTKHQPVGVMIFNNSSLAGCPWELIIKSYRNLIKKSSQDTILDYSIDFIEFICSEKEIITDNMRMLSAKNLFVQALMKLTKDVNENKMVTLIQSGRENVNVMDFYEQLGIALNNEISTLNSSPYFFGLNQQDYDDAITYVNGYVQESYVQLLPLDPSIALPAELNTLLIKLAALLICKVQNSELYTGLVIAGYGNKQHYPAIRTLHVYGFFKDKLLYQEITDKTKVSDPFQAGICPFAQEDEVVTFIEGCNRNVNKFTDTLAGEIITKSISQVTELLKDKLNEEEISFISSSLEDSRNATILSFQQKKSAFITSNHVTKMLSMLHSLGKVDLSYMAESLVDITAFKRRISHDHETVGGPVDVAVISKGDGFVWIKRKHYFPKEINSNFFARKSTH